jgi:hypothetical protein
LHLRTASYQLAEKSAFRYIPSDVKLGHFHKIILIGIKEEITGSPSPHI